MKKKIKFTNENAIIIKCRQRAADSAQRTFIYAIIR